MEEKKNWVSGEKNEKDGQKVCKMERKETGKLVVSSRATPVERDTERETERERERQRERRKDNAEVYLWREKE